jgi:hypothetical protein
MGETFLPRVLTLRINVFGWVVMCFSENPFIMYLHMLEIVREFDRKSYHI